MSFLDDILDVGSSILDIGSSAIGWLGGSGLGPSLARTAITGFALNQFSNSVNSENQTNTSTKVDPGVRLQVKPDTEHYLPVVYGNAWIGGIVTDAELTNGNKSMYYCLALCEQTGVHGYGLGAQSQIFFGDIYWDDMRLIFANDGISVASAVDREGNICDKIGGNVWVYLYSGNSESGVVPLNYTNASVPEAYNVMPSWTVNHMMSDTVFAIIRIDYDATKGIKGLGDVRFQLYNTLQNPGEVLYDYMTNTRYGAGIPAEEIYA